MSKRAERARDLRQQQTEAEELLWQILRARRFCGLKFRRQHPVGPFFADFACESLRCIIELDGGYHEFTAESDCSRQTWLEHEEWHVLRFVNEDVLTDVDAVALSIARQLGLEPEFRASKNF